MNEFNLTNNSNHNVRLVAEKDAICIKHIPPDGLYDSIVVSFVDDIGHRLDSHPINKTHDTFVIQLQNIHPGRYSMTCYKRSFAFEPYNPWFTKIPIVISPDRSASFEQSPVFENNIKCFQQMASQPYSLIASQEKPAGKISRIAKQITLTSSTTYNAALAIHDYISRTISYDMDAYNKMLNKEKVDYSKVSDALLVLSSGIGVCSGYANLAVDMFTSIGIPAKTINCFALGRSTEGRWSKENIQSDHNHVITAAYIDNRWVLMDMTWDSIKKYEKGHITKHKPLSREYFDPTLQLLSVTHKLFSL